MSPRCRGTAARSREAMACTGTRRPRGWRRRDRAARPPRPGPARPSCQPPHLPSVPQTLSVPSRPPPPDRRPPRSPLPAGRRLGLHGNAGPESRRFVRASSLRASLLRHHSAPPSPWLRRAAAEPRSRGGGRGPGPGSGQGGSRPREHGPAGPPRAAMYRREKSIALRSSSSALYNNLSVLRPPHKPVACLGAVHGPTVTVVSAGGDAAGCAQRQLQARAGGGASLVTQVRPRAAPRRGPGRHPRAELGRAGRGAERALGEAGFRVVAP